MVRGAGKLVGSSFYWQSTKPDRLDHDKGKWFVTPTSEYADFTALGRKRNSSSSPTPVTPPSRTAIAGRWSLPAINSRAKSRYLSISFR